MILLITALLIGAVASTMPEEAAQIQVVDAVQGGDENIFIKVNGFHKDTKDSVYMQVNLAIAIEEGLVTVNNQILPVKELKTFQLEAEIIEIQEGLQMTPFTDTVTVHMFLHEDTMVQGDDGVTNALRLECQIIETDQYDVHMINVTEVVLEMDSSRMELRRSVTMISESESKLHQARHCPLLKCRAVVGCIDWKKNEVGCQTCQCSAMEERPEECLSSCEGVCPGDSKLDDPVEGSDGCWICPCLVIDDFPRPAPCSYSYGTDLISKFNELPDSVRIMIIVMLSVLSVVLTITCCITVCCNPAKPKSQRTNNLKTFGFGKLQIYVPDNEKKAPLIDNLDVVSADIA